MKKLISIISLSALLLTTGVGMANAAEKIAIVDVMAILQKMPQREVIAKSLQKEFATQGKALQEEEKKAQAAAQKLKKDSMTLSASEKTKLQKTISSFETKARNFSQEYRKRENEEVSKLLAKIQKVINDVAKKDQYAVVLKAEAAFYADKSVDITEKVLQQVK